MFSFGYTTIEPDPDPTPLAEWMGRLLAVIFRLRAWGTFQVRVTCSPPTAMAPWGVVLKSITDGIPTGLTVFSSLSASPPRWLMARIWNFVSAPGVGTSTEPSSTASRLGDWWMTTPSRRTCTSSAPEVSQRRVKLSPLRAYVGATQEMMVGLPSR